MDKNIMFPSTGMQVMSSLIHFIGEFRRVGLFCCRFFYKYSPKITRCFIPSTLSFASSQLQLDKLLPCVELGTNLRRFGFC